MLSFMCVQFSISIRLKIQERIAIEVHKFHFAFDLTMRGFIFYDTNNGITSPNENYYKNSLYVLCFAWQWMLVCMHTVDTYKQQVYS